MRTLLAVLLSATAAPAADWPQWLGPQRDGVWREDGIFDTFPQGGPKKVWAVPVGLGYAGPAVAAGKLFVTDRQLGGGQTNPANPFDSKTPVGGTERVLCLDAATGKELWKHEYPSTYRISYSAGPRCTPTVDGPRVYTLGAMGDLFCLDVASGKVVWSKNFPKDYAATVPVWGFACHPLIDGDKLICVGGGPDKLVIAFDKTTGKELWASQNCEGDFGYCPPVILEFGGRRQLIVWHTRAVLGLDPETGQRIWAVPFDVKSALTAPTPRQVGDSQLFITSFYNGAMLLNVTADSVSVAWKSKARGERPDQTTDLSSIMSTPIVDGPTIYGVDSHGELRGLEAATGKRLWTTMRATRGALTPARVAASELPDPGVERWSNAFIVKQADRYFLFNEQGDLIIARMTPDGYEEVSRAHLLDPTNTMARGRKVVWMHPAFAGGRVYVRNDRELICYDLRK